MLGRRIRYTAAQDGIYIIYAHIYIYIYIYPIKTSLNRPIMGLTLNEVYGDGQFRVLGYRYNGIVWMIDWDPNKVIDRGK